MADLLSVPGLRTQPPEVLRLVADVCERNGWNCDAFVAHIQTESGWDPAATNPQSGATGIIQWMPATAKAYGTTTDDLRHMSVWEQLHLAEEYFRHADGRCNLSEFDFTVAGLGTGNAPPGPFTDATILYAAGTKGAKQNPAFQADGNITVGRARQYLQDRVAAYSGVPRIEVPSEDEPPPFVIPQPGEAKPKTHTRRRMWPAIAFPALSVIIAWAKLRSRQ